MIDVKKILATNEDRLIDLAQPYNPLTGVGSLIERFEFRISSHRSIWLPIMMQTDKMVQDVLTFEIRLKNTLNITLTLIENTSQN